MTRLSQPAHDIGTLRRPDRGMPRPFLAFCFGPGIFPHHRCSTGTATRKHLTMNKHDRLFLEQKAARCRENAEQAGNETERALWREMAEELSRRASISDTDVRH
jgi:hypothetical protein